MGLFGDITRKLFGGSKSTDESGNLAYGDIKSAYAPAMGYTAQGGDAVSRFLGGDASGFNAYKDATGFKFGLGEGLDGITGGAAARGLLRSGPTSKALVRYGNDYSQQYARDYLSQNLGLGQLGLGAGALVGDAGRYSKGKATKDEGGLGKALAMLFASDPRLKTNVVRIGEHPDGLGIYTFDYLPHDGPIAAFMPEGRQVGVMADEVARLRPWALGPEIGGFATVHYDRLAA